METKKKSVKVFPWLGGICLFLVGILVFSVQAGDLPKIRATFDGLSEDGRSVIVSIFKGGEVQIEEVRVTPKTRVRLQDGAPIKIDEILKGDSVEISYQEILEGSQKQKQALIIVVTPSPR